MNYRVKQIISEYAQFTVVDMMISDDVASSRWRARVRQDAVRRGDARKMTANYDCPRRSPRAASRLNAQLGLIWIVDMVACDSVRWVLT